MSKFNLGPRLPVSSRYFTLPADVANPHHDRRCKYGHRAIRVYRAGTSINVIDYEQTLTREDGEQETHGSRDYFIADTYSTARVVPSDVAAEFAKHDPGESREPATIKEAACEAGTSVETLCRYAIKSLLASGKLTIEDVLQAYETSEVDEFIPE